MSEEKKDENDFIFPHAKTPERLLIEICFHYNVLMEYQLIDLQGKVREFVENMYAAIQKMDKLVQQEKEDCLAIFESLFSQDASTESGAIAARANRRADSIFLDAKSEIGQGEYVDPELSPEKDANEKSDTKKEENETLNAYDELHSRIAKELENVCRLDERLRPQVYTMISSLNFEDIQTQRLEHLVTAQKQLNEGLMNYLKRGLSNTSLEELHAFTHKLLSNTRDNYTMKEERDVFDQVFYDIKDKIKKKKR